jgi:hypothetical protein
MKKTDFDLLLEIYITDFFVAATQGLDLVTWEKNFFASHGWTIEEFDRKLKAVKDDCIQKLHRLQTKINININ